MPVKSADRQAALLDHKARDFLVRQRTQIVNAIRAHLGEFGAVVAKGIHNIDCLLDAARDVPPAAIRRSTCWPVSCVTHRLGSKRVRRNCASSSGRCARRTRGSARCRAKTSWHGDWQRCLGWAQSCPARLQPPPPTWPLFAARDYAVWLGLPPRAHSNGGKERLGRISKAGNRYLRRLLYLGTMAQISAGRGRRDRPAGQGLDWLSRMLARKPVKVVAVALADRMARTIWALIASGSCNRAAPA